MVFGKGTDGYGKLYLVGNDYFFLLSSFLLFFFSPSFLCALFGSHSVIAVGFRGSLLGEGHDGLRQSEHETMCYRMWIIF